MTMPLVTYWSVIASHRRPSVALCALQASGLEKLSGSRRKVEVPREGRAASQFPCLRRGCYANQGYSVLMTKWHRVFSSTLRIRTFFDIFRVNDDTNPRWLDCSFKSKSSLTRAKPVQDQPLVLSAHEGVRGVLFVGVC